jgi:hypothetical protein
MHGDRKRRKRYLIRHGGLAPDFEFSGRELWGTSGFRSPGFWSRHLLWNKPTLKGSARDIRKKFGIKVKFT